MDVIIATNNAHKADEISNTFKGLGIRFLTLEQAGISSDPEEDADSFEGNARIKALAARKALGSQAAEFAVLADDSGLEVDALDGAPGVYTSRYSGNDGDDEANNELLLKNMADTPDDERTARFVCTMVLIDSEGNETVSRGAVEGMIGYRESGDKGFGYDPLFYPLAYNGEKTFAEVPQDEKNKISHRAKALFGLSDEMKRVSAL